VQRGGRFERSGVAVLELACAPRALSTDLIEQIDRLLCSALAS
jgi:hypothetical protein